jgi:predicted transcriptional regulator
MYVRKPKPSYAPRWQDRWYEDDVAELLARKVRGETNREIARALGRTPKAVKFRLEVVR